MKNIVIIAPHADDEIIGCHGILASNKVHTVFYGSQKAVNEAGDCANYFKFIPKLYHEYLIRGFENLNLYFPDPTSELHPDHRFWGGVGEILLREGLDVIFYTTNMNVPYIFEVPYSETKHFRLNCLYPQKKDLWKYDHKYFLFEGYTKWLINE